MSNASAIEWTNATWNPVSGCTRVSAGCDHCYAVAMTHRLEKMGQPKYAGLTVLNPRGDRHFNGTVRCDEEALTIPLHWRKPRRIFVNSMSDLFHRGVPFEFIDRVFAVMALCPQHTFQVLTKRPERMAEYLNEQYQVPAHMMTTGDAGWEDREERVKQCATQDILMGDIGDRDEYWTPDGAGKHWSTHWPLPNVWLGTSCENQQTADERIPHLLRCPAAVRFLSCEPLLGEIDLSAFFGGQYVGLPGDVVHPNYNFGIGWVIVGGESGPNARTCDVEWIRSIVRQCKAAAVPCFVKQLGSRPMIGDVSEPHGWPVKDGPVDWETGRIHLRDRKGGDPAEWPADLLVREMPERTTTWEK